MAKTVFVTTRADHFHNYFRTPVLVIPVNNGPLLGFVPGALYFIEQSNDVDYADRNAAAISGIIARDNLAGNEIYIAVHDTRGDVSYNRVACRYMARFIHGNNVFCNAICAASRNCGVQELDALCAEVVRNAPVTRFDALKHAIDKMFGPLDMHIQAVLHLLDKGDRTEAEKYYRENITAPNVAYTTRHAVLAYYVSGNNVAIPPRAVYTPTPFTDGFIPGRGRRDRDREAELCTLCGLTSQGAVRPRSAIYVGLGELVNGVPCGQQFEDWFRCVMAKMPEGSFHDWYVKLMEKLDDCMFS